MTHLVGSICKKHPDSGQSGFTLVDILVGLAMASVILVAVVSLFSARMGEKFKNTTRRPTSGR